MNRLYLIVPVVTFFALLYGWEYYVAAFAVPAYVLPAPSVIAKTLVQDWSLLAPAWAMTLALTITALFLAVVFGVMLAIVLTSSRIAEYMFMPFTIFLQVTPIIAVAPLILIYTPNTLSATLLIAWIVAFFPILSSTMFGIQSADKNLRDLFTLYGANRFQKLFLLRLPYALPQFLNGLKIAAGLSLIGAIVAEFAAGSLGAGDGLAFRLLEAGYRSNIPRMFACLALISLTGLALYVAIAFLSHLLLRRWHDSARSS